MRMREIGWHDQMRRTDLIRRSPRAHLPVNGVARTQYGLGARGIDWIRNKVGSDPETIVFPIYDGRGNMIYTLTREANDGHDLGNKRIYGAWGDLRHDSNPGDGPNTQYVGNLGHKKDNESGLTYMRARYYEPWTGRFISEDPAGDGWNWFTYCGNDPINKMDDSGKKASPIGATWGFAIAAFFMFYFSWDHEGSTFLHAVKFVEAIVAGGAAYHINHPKTYAWVRSAANSFLKAIGMAAGAGDINRSMGPKTRNMLTGGLIISFYIGYSMSLWYLMHELDAWVEGHIR